MTRALSFGVILSVVTTRSLAFLPTDVNSGTRKSYNRVSSLYSKEDFNDDDDTEISKIPQLPAFGASSFSNSIFEDDASTKSFPVTGESSVDAAFVSSKFKIQYTCNVCDTRNSHMVSRQAYREGVVIAICKGCNSKHLIADNLNETPGMDGGSNIEEYFQAHGMDDSVARVTPEVFDLENILRLDSVGGSLIGEDGKPVLE